MPTTTSSPLLGKIWSYGEQKYISPAKLARDMAQADFALLGEIHDNKDHHRLQAWMVSAIASEGRRPAVVWEMFDTSQSEALAQFLASEPANADKLGAATGWGKTGWPDWAIYQPVAEAALHAGLAMFAGDPPVKLVREVGKTDYSILHEGQQAALLLDQPLGKELQFDLEKQIVTSHCDMIPMEATGPMYRGQRLRDAMMAKNMVAAGKTDGAILIAGSGHVRKDRAVPWYLKRLQPKRSVLSLMFVGVEDEDSDPANMVPKDPQGNPGADYVWFTPKVLRDDPCVALRKKFGK